MADFRTNQAGWCGATIDAVRSNYLDRWGRMVFLQANTIALLLLVLKAYQEQLRQAQNDVVTLVNVAEEVLSSYTGNKLRELDYGMVYRSAGGRLIGGWFASHALWSDIAKALPDGENERYPQGRSRHTMPAWLPPGIEPDRVSMHVWR